MRGKLERKRKRMSRTLWNRIKLFLFSAPLPLPLNKFGLLSLGSKQKQWRSCVQCVEPLKWVGYGHCGHRDVCSLCIVRLRFILGDKPCCIYKQYCPIVFITKERSVNHLVEHLNECLYSVTRFTVCSPSVTEMMKELGDYTTKIEDFSVLPALESGTDRQYWFHKDSQAYFDDDEHYNTIKAMCRLCCSICECMSEEAGNGFPKGVIKFEQIYQLKRHLFHVHGHSFCELCLEGHKVFICEQKLYTQAQLDRHLSRGDYKVDGNERERGGYMDHPMCNFCKKRFYGENELYQHMSREHYTCHLCQRMNPGHYEYFHNYNDLEVHFCQHHFLSEKAECLAKKFVVFASELEVQRHNALQHGGSMSRSQRNAALQIPVSFRYRREVGDQESHQGSRRRRHNGNDHENSAIEVSTELPILDNAIRESSMMRKTTQNVANSEVTNMASSSLGTEAGSSTSHSTNFPSMYLKAVTQYGETVTLEDSAFPPLPVANMSAKKKAETTTQICGKTMAAHCRHGRFGTLVVDRAEPRENRQHSSSASVSSGQLSSSVSVISAVSQVNTVSNICLKRTGPGTNSGVHVSPLPGLEFSGGMQAISDNFPPINGRQNVCSVSVSEKQNSDTSSAPSLSKKKMHAANKALVKHIGSCLGENDKQFAAFKNFSAEYRHGDIDGQNYYSCMRQLGLSDIVLEFVRLCPEPHKQKELLEIHNASTQNTNNTTLQTDIRVMGLPTATVADNSNTCREEKSKVGGNCSVDPTFSLILSSVHSRKLDRKSLDEKVKVLSRGGYWAGKGRAKMWETKDPGNASKAICSLNKAENNLNSEVLVESNQSSVPTCFAENIDSTERWSCLACTLINKADCSHCVACGMENPKIKSNKESNLGGRGKHKKKSKFHRLRLGDCSAATFVSLGNKEHSFEDRAKATSGDTERLYSHTVWNNGGGRILIALAQRNPSIWNSST